MSLKIEIGLDVIGSYKRLAYTPWHAIAEFVDNSTQSYFDNCDQLDLSFRKEGVGLEVSIVYEKDQDSGFLRVVDNAMGMSYDELQRALHVALPPINASGRGRYGMGMKTAACWLGNHWTIRTKRLGETVEHTLVIDVPKVASGIAELPYRIADGKPEESHYTVIEITQHNRRFQGRTLGKMKDFLRSMYRQDIRSGKLRLEWQGEILSWEGVDGKLLKAKDGSCYKKPFKFDVNGTDVNGWVGVLGRGSREDAGFSILHCGRVVRGWPDSWRPSSLYGQLQGSNDLVNQRLVGEINLDGFEVSHTKDDILWLGDEEEKVEEGLRVYCADYKDFAKEYRKHEDDERRPSEIETNAAIDELRKELTSPEMVDQLSIQHIPSAEMVDQAVERITESVVSTHSASLAATVGELFVSVFVDNDMSPNDPYVTTDSTSKAAVVVVVNTAHPHFGQLKGSDEVANYLRHCIYDAIAEWEARQKAARIDPNTIKLLKDQLLRVPFRVEEHIEDSTPIPTTPGQ